MLAILDIDVNDRYHRKLWLARGQTLRIGRTEEADVALPMDKALAPVHFMLRCTPSGCTVNAFAGCELQRNGSPVQQADLQNGDVLQAGTVRVKVTLEGWEVRSLPADHEHDGTRHAERDKTDEQTRKCFAERARSGAHVYRFEGSPTFAPELSALLETAKYLHAITARKDAQGTGPQRRAMLFDWLSERLATASPDIVLEVGPSPEHPRELENGSIAALLVAEATGDEFIEHVRLSARGQVNRTQPPSPDHMLLSFDASMLEDVLPYCEAEFVAFVFSKVTAIVFHSTCGHWTVISGRRLETLESCSSSTRTVISERPEASLPVRSVTESLSPACEVY